jgi:hypothetical protein
MMAMCIIHLDVLSHKLYNAFLLTLAQNVYNEIWKANWILIANTKSYSDGGDRKRILYKQKRMEHTPYVLYVSVQIQKCTVIC